ncbi:DUF6907 domain-containing protein [Kibdelosporangium lantanae]|uniref:DUF6907 domain-containing protein n=1 Tax=Kibdelosporangium lantanae TaxID=1497396 RepID=A0ABW3M0H1_9PSEU
MNVACSYNKKSETMLDDKNTSAEATINRDSNTLVSALCDPWCTGGHDVHCAPEDRLHFSRWEERIPLAATLTGSPLELMVDVQRRFDEQAAYVVVNEAQRRSLPEVRLLPQEAARFAFALLRGVATTGVAVTLFPSNDSACRD